MSTQTKVLSNAILKQILSDALVMRGTATDVDTTKTAGCYRISQSTLNTPLKEGSLGILIVATTEEISLQIVILWEAAPRIAYRLFSAFHAQAWRQITTTELSS